MQVQRASKFSLERLTEIWNLGYSGYFVPISLAPAQMERMILTGSLNLENCLVMLDGKEPVGFSMLGLRGEQGWIGGFGITPAYRGRGLAAELFQAHLLLLRTLGLRRVRLEVLVQNWAQKVYARAGFEIVRRLAVLAGPGTGEPAGRPADPGGDTRAVAAEPALLLSHSARCHRASPAVWQREPESILPALGDEVFGLCTGPASEPTGILLGTFRDGTVRVVDAAAEGVSEAAALLQAVCALHPGSRLFLVNEPEGSPVHRAATALGLEEVNAQYEMRLQM